MKAHFLIVCATVVGSVSALAQTVQSPGSGITTSPDRASPTTAPSANSPSVIHPGNPDPGMAVQPPASGMTPIVPPPGSASNNPTVIPK